MSSGRSRIIPGSFEVPELSSFRGPRTESEERVQQWSDTLHVLQLLKERGVPESLNDENADWKRRLTAEATLPRD
jgi:hypothetical protein